MVVFLLTLPGCLNNKHGGVLPPPWAWDHPLRTGDDHEPVVVVGDGVHPNAAQKVSGFFVHCFDKVQTTRADDLAEIGPEAELRQGDGWIENGGGHGLATSTAEPMEITPDRLAHHPAQPAHKDTAWRLVI